MNKTGKIILIISIIAILATFMLTIGYVIGNNESKSQVNKNNKKEQDQSKEIVFGEEEKKLLNGEVIIYNFEEKDKERIIKLDLNLDGKKEIIKLGEIEYGETFETMEVMINSSTIVYESLSIVSEVVAFAMDDKKIIISVHSNGMSDDFSSVLYTYDGENIENAGLIPYDISEANKDMENGKVIIEDKVLKCYSGEGTLSNYVYRNFDWDGTKLVIREEKELEYTSQDEKLKLKGPIMVYDECNTGSNSRQISGGIVHPIKKGVGNWNYIRGEDDIEGWINFKDEDYYDIFENSNLAG